VLTIYDTMGLALVKHDPALAMTEQTVWFDLVNPTVEEDHFVEQALGISIPTRLASDLTLPDRARTDATARLVALCQAVGADTYLAGRDGALYLDADQFAAAGIAVETQRYEHPVYVQEHGEFAPFLSALDLLLMHGDEALGILCEGNTWARLSPEPR